MRIAITGSKGQLGSSLLEVLRSDTLLGIDLPEHDITDLEQTLATVERFAPDVVIHAAAMTDVDGCERYPDAAYRSNALGTRNVAVAAQRCACPMVYISTDYVFDGNKAEPYWEYDEPSPLSVYGRTKWIGERIVRDLVPRHYVVRVAWLYGEGPRNFVRTVRRLAHERERLTMVADEEGSPTYALDLARALKVLVRIPAYGIYHLPNSGVCSRYEWAREILSVSGMSNVTLDTSTNYKRVARVPKRVELRNAFGAEIGIVMRPWQEALREYLSGERS